MTNITMYSDFELLEDFGSYAYESFGKESFTLNITSMGEKATFYFYENLKIISITLVPRIFGIRPVPSKMDLSNFKVRMLTLEIPYKIKNEELVRSFIQNFILSGEDLKLYADESKAYVAKTFGDRVVPCYFTKDFENPFLQIEDVDSIKLQKAEEKRKRKMLSKTK